MSVYGIINLHILLNLMIEILYRIGQFNVICVLYNHKQDGYYHKDENWILYKTKQGPFEGVEKTRT